MMRRILLGAAMGLALAAPAMAQGLPDRLAVSQSLSFIKQK